MYQEKRPTCVTVIGWVWIIMGSLMCLSGVMALFALMMMNQMVATQPEAQQNIPAMIRWFPLLALVQIAVAALGIVAGVNFLKLKSWGRQVLEVLTWIIIVFIVGFMIFWITSWMSMTSGQAPAAFSLMGLVMGIIMTAIYGVPLGIMLKFLRGARVKGAMMGEGASSARP